MVAMLAIAGASVGHFEGHHQRAVGHPVAGAPADDPQRFRKWHFAHDFVSRLARRAKFAPHAIGGRFLRAEAIVIEFNVVGRTIGFGRLSRRRAPGEARQTTKGEGLSYLTGPRRAAQATFARKKSPPPASNMRYGRLFARQS